MVCDGQDVSTRFFGSQRYVDGYNHLLIAVLDGLMPAQTRPPETGSTGQPLGGLCKKAGI